jgi:hypothetical protein
LAVLFAPHTVRQAPTRDAAKLRVVEARRPITGEQTILPIVGQATAKGERWLRVELPGRPNGGTGWILQAGTVERSTTWHIVVALARRQVLVYRSGRIVRSFSAVIGKPSTPTPVGRFFVEEDVALPSGAVGAPFALALSARSNVLATFDGGPGQIALHGLANVGGTPGTAVSHGCLRLPTAAMDWLVARIAPGVPVTIQN